MSWLVWLLRLVRRPWLAWPIAEGDYEAAQPYIFRTSNGGLSNTQFDLRGVFVGASLPALPLVGLGALAACLAVAGSRRLLR